MSCGPRTVFAVDGYQVVVVLVEISPCLLSSFPGEVARKDVTAAQHL